MSIHPSRFGINGAGRTARCLQVNDLNHTAEQTVVEAKNNIIVAQSFQHEPKGPMESQEHARPLILVADDNASFLLFAKKIIEAGGFDCITTDSPHIALRIVSEKHPSVVFCDINFGIGKNTALDVFNNIRGKNIDVPFIIVSAFIQNEFSDRAKKAGINDYLIKPLEAKELIAAIKKYIPE